MLFRLHTMSYVQILKDFRLLFGTLYCASATAMLSQGMSTQAVP